MKFLSPSFFETKEIAKYFLIILGDNILKKNQDFIFLVNKNSKDFLSDISTICNKIINTQNVTNNFMVKYHQNYDYSKCRLININDIEYVDIWKKMLKEIGLNLVCVATHYSNRYGNSENYVNCKCENEMKN